MPGAACCWKGWQTGGILVGEANKFAEKVVLARQPCPLPPRRAGPAVESSFEVEMLRPEGASSSRSVLVGGQVVVEAEIFFAHLDRSLHQQIFGNHNFVFGGEG